MPWQLRIIIRVFFSYGIAVVIIKKLASSTSRLQNLISQYFFAVLITWLIAFFFEGLVFNFNSLLIFLIGMTSALASYAQWRAYDLSLSRTAVFSLLDDYIAIALGLIILEESKFITSNSLLGIILALSSAAIMLIANLQKNKLTTKLDSEQNEKSIFYWIGIYSVIWGFSSFALKYFVVDGVGIFNFCSLWYLGGLLASSMMFLFKEKSFKFSISKSNLLLTALNALVISTSLSLTLWVYQVVPITYAQSIFQSAEMFIPSIIGLFIFKEIKFLSNLEKIGILVGILGAVFICLSA